MPLSRERRILLVTAIFAGGVPAGAAAWVAHARNALEDHLGAAAALPAHVGGIDASLTGAVRLTDVSLGQLVAADAIEASVSLESLLSGQIGADEIRVEAPRVALDIDRSGDSDLARLVHRLSHAGSGGGPGTRVRRIVVSSGTLAAHVAGIADLTADGVELVPDAGGVRVITGRVHVHAGTGRLHGDLELARSAAEVALPHLRFGRVLAVAGQATIVADDRTIALRDVAVGRLHGGALELRASLDDGGVPREVAADLTFDPGSRTDLAIVLRGDRVPLAAFSSFAPHGAVLDGARATGSLAIRRHADQLQLAVDGAIEGLALDHRTLAAQPIAVAAAVRGALSLSPDAITLEGGALDIGAAHWSASGWLRRGWPASGQLQLRLAPAPCADLLASLPLELRGPLDAMAVTGTFGGRAHLAVDLAAPPGEGVALDVALDNGCDVTAEPPAADVAQLAGQAEHVFADGSRAKVGEGLPGWFELRRLPAYVPAAFVSAEDARFYDHHGFDVTQIARSFEIDLRDRRLVRGGSTISQQLIKNAFLTQRRSLDRKIQEAILTWRLESRLPKRAILERYLNIIELGPHIYGIRAAAAQWFGISPRELSLHQAAFLAAMTSEPQSMSHRVRHAGGVDPDTAARVDVILRAMRRDGAIDKNELDRARETPLVFAPAVLRREP